MVVTVLVAYSFQKETIETGAEELIMNSSNITSSSITPLSLPEADCRVWKKEYQQENYVSTAAAIIVNMLTSPLTVFINVLVIVAVTTKRRLQTNYNILLACLAVADLLVGAVVQPSFIVGEMYLITGASLPVYCARYNRAIFSFLSPCVASLLLLALLSIERYFAMKYSLKYELIMTKTRLTIAVVCCGTVAVIPSIFVITASLPYQALSITVVLVCSSLVVIVYCHISVYFVTRRHMRQIKSEQVAQDAKTKFLKEKKAAITTTIIIGFVLFSFVPSVVYRFIGPFPVDYYFGNLFISFKPLLLSCFLVNSLCNPIIYCWRSSVLRKAIKELLMKRDNG